MCYFRAAKVWFLGCYCFFTHSVNLLCSFCDVSVLAVSNYMISYHISCVNIHVYKYCMNKKEMQETKVHIMSGLFILDYTETLRI